MRTSITLLSSDKHLVDSLWELKSPDIELDQLFMKALPPPDFIHEITAYVEDAAVVISVLAALFQRIKSKNIKQPSTTSININCAENSTNVIQFIEANKGEINVTVNKTSIDGK